MEDFGYKYYSTKEQFELEINNVIKLNSKAQIRDCTAYTTSKFIRNFASKNWNGSGYYHLLLSYYDGVLASEYIKDEIDGCKMEIEKLTKRLNELYKIRGENS